GKTIVVDEEFCFVLRNGSAEAGLFFFSLSFLRELHIASSSTAAHANGAFLEANGECIGAHRRETLGKLLIHCLDGSDDPHKRHNTEGDDGDSYAGAKFIAPNRSKCKRDDITDGHGAIY